MRHSPSALLLVLLVGQVTASHSGTPTTTPRVLFSDIDGTIVHYKGFLDHGVKVVQEDTQVGVGMVRDENGEMRACKLVPSSTMGFGYISFRTADLIHKLRASGIKFAMVSGARTSTMMRRIPKLPAADAVVCETGSCIFFPTQDSSGRFEWMLDEGWMKRMQPAVGDQKTDLPPDQRIGPLWDLYRKLVARGFKADANGYTASFRVTANNTSEEDELQKERKLLEGTDLCCRCNLGHFDFMSAIAGKGNAVRYLQQMWGIGKHESAAMFDDDNDLCMAEQCRWCLLPSLTSASVRHALGNNPHWIPSESCGAGVFACEEALQRIVDGRLDEPRDLNGQTRDINSDTRPGQTRDINSDARPGKTRVVDVGMDKHTQQAMDAAHVDVGKHAGIDYTKWDHLDVSSELQEDTQAAMQWLGSCSLAG